MKLKLRMTPHRKCTRGGALGLPAVGRAVGDFIGFGCRVFAARHGQAEGRRFLPGARPPL
jgi:hypothetical protein